MKRRGINFRTLFFPLMIGSLVAASFSVSSSSANQTANTPSDKAAFQLASLSPEEKVGQLFIMTFNGVDTSSLSPIYDLITNYHIGGVVLNRDNDNFLNPAQIPYDCWVLTGNLQRIGYDSSQKTEDSQDSSDSGNTEYIPLFIGLSQEGNLSEYTEILSGLSPIPSQMALGATWDPSLAEQIGSQIGRELSSLGINMLFGPSLDVVSNPSPGQSDLGVRSFGGDPYWVGKFGQAYIQGIHDGSLNNIAVVAKYFPGLGASDRLPEEEVATVRKSLEQLKQIDLAPFFAVTGNAPTPASSADALLNSHIRYQGFQGNIRSTTRPISLDPQAFGLLMSLEPLGSWRDSGGLIISDNLGSQALRRLYDPSGLSFNISRVALDAFIAGNDILFLGNYGYNNKPIPAQEIISTLKFFAQKYNEDQDFAERVNSSVLRILTLKNSLYSNFNLATVLTSENTLSALGNSNISEHIARQSATLVNPNISELDSIIQTAPNSSDRLVILSDTETASVCSDCPDISTLGTKSLENAIIRLYGPLSGRQLDRANIISYSFKDLTTLLDFPSEVEHMVTDIYNANWIIVASLDVNEGRPYSNALTRLLAERQDLLRNKKIIVFAFGAPYYLDATNISKISAFFALYNKLPVSLDVSARILFKEFPTFTGSLPVSVPGINYDLISATSPDPSVEFSVYLGGIPGNDATSESSASTPTAPVYRVEDIIDLYTGIILDHNGHPVPDGTPVNFVITSRGNITPLPQVTTLDGSAYTSYLVKDGYNLTIRAESSLASSNSIEINIVGDNSSATSIESVNATPDQDGEALIATQTQSDDPSNEDVVNNLISPWGNWFFALFVVAIISLAAYQFGAKVGLVRWGIRWSLSGLIGGLLIYNYIVLDLPGVAVLFPKGVTRFGLGLSVAGGAFIGWLVSYIVQRISNK